ncbi:hypothetical protein BHE74_00039219 [Ensete ventricosum]|nr:hypothetical protein BHE74_00039219 [Ensete ventricosum]
MNFNMNKLEMTLLELLNMSREVESTIKKEKSILYISETKKKRKVDMSLNKGKGKGRLGKAKVTKKDPMRNKGQCFHSTRRGTAILEIRGEVKARQSYTLMVAISFARVQEEQLNHEVRRTRVTP